MTVIYKISGGHVMKSEISIRELIEILLKGKWIIIIAVIITSIISEIGSIILVKPVYEAVAILSTTPMTSDNKTTTTDIDYNAMIDTIGKYPDMTVDTYKEQFINPVVLSETISELNLLDKNGKKISNNALAQRINVSTIEGTNLLKVIVKDSDSARSAEIANTLSKKVIEFISDSTKKLGVASTVKIEELMKDEEAKLEEQAKILQEYINVSPNVDQMKLEVTSLNDKIIKYKSDLYDVEEKIMSDQTALNELKGSNQGADVSDHIKVNIPIKTDNNTNSNTNNNTDNKADNDTVGNNDNSKDNDIELQFDLNSSKLDASITTIGITEMKLRLVQNSAKQNSLNTKIGDMEKRLNEVQSELTIEEYKYNALKRKYDLAEQTYNSYLDRYKQAVITAASDLGDSAIIISSPATTPVEESGHGRMFYLAVGATLGVMIGILVVYFKAYWKTSDPKNRKIESTAK